MLPFPGRNYIYNFLFLLHFIIRVMIKLNLHKSSYYISMLFDESQLFSNILTILRSTTRV